MHGQLFAELVKPAMLKVQRFSELLWDNSPRDESMRLLFVGMSLLEPAHMDINPLFTVSRIRVSSKLFA